MRRLTAIVLSNALIILVAAGFAAVVLGMTIAQEVPTGSVCGRVLDEDGVPLAGARAVVYSEGVTRSGITDEDGMFKVTDVPEGIECGGYAAARGYESRSLTYVTEGKQFRVKEGKTTYLADLRLDPRPPRIYGSINSVFTPGEEVKFPLRGYSRKPVAHVRMRVYTYDYAQRVRSRGAKPEPYDDELSKWRSLGEPVVDRTLDIPTDSEGYFSRDVVVPIKDVGGYLMHVELESAEKLFRTLITDLALVVKRGPEKTLVYASSFTDRKPAAGVKLEFFRKNGRLNVMGTTDERGIFVSKDLSYGSIVTLGTAGRSYALNYGYSGSEDDKYRCYIYTDRPVYRPGHKVRFKGILRTSLPGKYIPVSGKRVSVVVEDSDGSEVLNISPTTNGFGSFHGEVDLNAEAVSGYYSITASYGGEKHHGSFKVEEYRKPEFRASIAFDKTNYVGGHKAHATVEATYYFGAPVAQARVKYTVYRSWSYFHYYPDEASDTSFYDEFFAEERGDYYYGHGEVLLEDQGFTDENGILKIQIPTDRTDHEQDYVVEASVMEPGGRSVEISGGVMVTPGLYKLWMDSDKFIYKPGETAKTRIIAVDYERKRVPDVSVKVSVIEQYPYSGRKQRVAHTETVRLNSKGEGVFTYKPRKQGYLVVKGEATDRLKSKIIGNAWLWVADDDWSGEDDYEPPALELTVDKKLYRVGDVARVMITSPEKDCSVLFTIEGRRLFDYRVFPLTANTKMIEIPITQEYTPNVYASACFVKGKKFVRASKPICVSPDVNFLKVKVETDKERYQPGEKATYRITTLDKAGRGVSAEVSLGVVDESVYAIREDMTPDIRKFFHGPVWNHVRTSISFSDYYYGGEDKFKGRVRKDFRDTAYWNPTIVTDANGEAAVSFKLPDNLTTWRATARAVTRDTAVGSVVQKTISTKNLLVRLQTPRFFRQRDEIRLSAVVHNYTDQDQRVRVWLKASGIKLEREKTHTLTLGKRGAGKVDWLATVPNPGTAKITVYAQGQGDQDAMELVVPVLAHGVEERVFASGEADRKAEFTLTTKGDIISSASELELGISPGIAPVLLGFTRSLGDYKYQSAEGIMDVLLPNVVVYEAMRNLGYASEDQRKAIDKLVAEDLRRVYRWQMPGGGWGWAEFGGKDPWMTAYVVYGLLVAHRNGVPVDSEVLRRGINATLKSLPDEGNIGRRSSMIYALTLAKQAKIEWIDKILYDEWLQNYSLALMILSLAEMGETERARSLIPNLETGAIETALHCYWPERFTWGFYSCNRYETTAYAVRALLAVDPDNPRIPKAVRWLLAHRSGGRYHSNYDTASVVYALADYMKVYRPPVPDYTARVYLNGTLMGTVRMDEGSVYKPEVRLNRGGSAIREGKNVITIEKDGQGELFYWALMKYHSARENIEAVDGRVSVRREYYRLELVRDPKEGLVHKTRRLGKKARVGDLIRCRITVESPKDFQYLIVEDMLPSGCEVVQREGFYDYWGGWDYWWGGEVVHDNRVSFTLHRVYGGKRVIEYEFRPEMRGSFHVMPAVAQGYFEPDIFAHSAERRLVIE